MKVQVNINQTQTPYQYYDKAVSVAYVGGFVVVTHQDPDGYLQKTAYPAWLVTSVEERELGQWPVNE